MGRLFVLRGGRKGEGEGKVNLAVGVEPKLMVNWIVGACRDFWTVNCHLCLV